MITPTNQPPKVDLALVNRFKIRGRQNGTRSRCGPLFKIKLVSVLVSSALAAVGTDYSAQGENWDETCALGAISQLNNRLLKRNSQWIHSYSNYYTRDLNYLTRENEFDVTLNGENREHM